MTRTAALPSELADDRRRLADRVEQLDLAEILGARPAHDHEPGIVRDTVRCPACAATLGERDRKEPRA
jgi:hypothetical protein